MADITNLVADQRAYFATKQTLDVSFRKAQLKRLYQAIQDNEAGIFEALKTDLNKSEFESYATEISMVYTELKYMIKHLETFSKAEKRGTPIVHFPSISRVQYDPYGCVLIMSPWNYPLQLCLAPLVGAIAAGNCVVVKPSNYSPATTKILAKILSIFPDDYIAVVEGGRQENQALLDQQFDFIFFTGGTKVAKLVMEKAAKHLTPVALELGGKSPCIVDKTANIHLSAKRIVWGKLLNAGQTCVAPDYILVQESVREALVAEIHKCIKKFYGDHPETNAEYPKIINETHFDRLSNLAGTAVTNPGTLQIAPVVVDGATWEDAV
ncbi:MAG: aldehyde dehydrogenase family protein, partial [Eubacteriales bacterium]